MINNVNDARKNTETETHGELCTEALFLAMERVEGLLEKGRQQYFDKAGINPLPITQPDEELADILSPVAMFWTRLFNSGRTKEDCDEIVIHEAYVSGLKDAQEAQKQETIARLKDADLKIYPHPGDWLRENGIEF